MGSLRAFMGGVSLLRCIAKHAVVLWCSCSVALIAGTHQPVHISLNLAVLLRAQIVLEQMHIRNSIACCNCSSRC
jgi:hypothetical protein